jgi:hypothetical protein
MAMTHAEFEHRLRVLVKEYAGAESPPAVPAGQCLATALEDAAMAVGDQIAREILRVRYEACPEEQAACPGCGKPGLKKGHRKRRLATRRGEVEFDEPEFYCKKCRRSFFPSVGGVGAGS